jgi:peptidyl-prolyl cis-trans isomerase A (cyclophilin A)
MLTLNITTKKEDGMAQSVNVICETTKGPVDIAVYPEWSPLGAARFLQLVDDGFFKDVPLFRCVENFLCQFGSVPPRPGAKTYSTIRDDPKVPSLRHFQRGFLSFAGNGEHSRSTHMFIVLGEQIDSLGTMPWETPFGLVQADSMRNVVARFNTSYGDIPPWGAGPHPSRIEAADGAAYLRRNFLALDYIRSCRRGS